MPGVHHRSVGAALALVALGGCGDDPIRVQTSGTSDYNRGALQQAVARFVAAKRTAAAYGALATELVGLRPGMDETVAEVAELQLVTLALDPVEAAQALPPAARARTLATTVWPIALAPPFDVLAVDGWRDPREAPFAVRAGEDADAYVRRLCEVALAVECKHVVPEWQGAVLGAEAVERMTQRARAAVADCEECTDPAWHHAVARWETLDHAAVADRRGFEEQGATSRWPVATAASEARAAVSAEIAVEPDGDWILEGSPIDRDRRVEVLADRRGGAVGASLGVHLRPEARVDVLEQVVAAAAAAGYADVMLEVRADVYPWELRAHRVPATPKPRLGRPGDTVQVFVRALRPAAGR